eukprot:jgi/Mesen1/7602/ME000395S06759
MGADDLKHEQQQGLDEYKPGVSDGKQPVTLSEGDFIEVLYCCKACQGPLGLSTRYLWPPGMHFQGGNRKSLSFARADESRLRQEETTTCGPFWDNRNSWGISRTRTLLRCASCSAKIGYLCLDGPSAAGGHGQCGFGPSQYTPRVSRYRIKEQAVAPYGARPAKAGL